MLPRQRSFKALACGRCSACPSLPAGQGLDLVAGRSRSRVRRGDSASDRAADGRRFRGLFRRWRGGSRWRSRCTWPPRVPTSPAHSERWCRSEQPEQTELTWWRRDVDRRRGNVRRSLPQRDRGGAAGRNRSLSLRVPDAGARLTYERRGVTTRRATATDFELSGEGPVELPMGAKPR
jgi:hypothetical protein